MKAARLIGPALRSDGTCSACVGGWTCKFHQEENAERDRERCAMLQSAARHIRAVRIAELCSSLELEGDESGSREDRAARMLGAESFTAYVTA